MENSTPHYMEPYYKSRIAELERQLETARTELARIALRGEETEQQWLGNE